MVGHRSPRYEDFGWASARLDDALGWPAARAGAGLTVLCSGAARGRAWRVLRRDGGAHPSPNAGRMEAAFAGALGLRLGGPLAYDGRVELRPSLGDGPGGRAPDHTDIRRANRLSSRVGAAALARERRAGRSVLAMTRGALLVCGTHSDAGKSIVTAGLCRWLPAAACRSRRSSRRTWR